MPLRTRTPLTLIVSAHAISLIGSEMTRFAIPIWLFLSTKDATVVGMASAAAFLPRAIVSPFAGVLADRWLTRKPLVVCDVLQSVLTVALAAFALSPYHTHVWALYGFLFLGSSVAALRWCAVPGTISLLADREQLPRLNGILFAAEASAGLTAPVAAAVALSSIGIGGILAIDAATFVASALLLSFISLPAMDAPPAQGRMSTLMVETFRKLFADASLRDLALLSAAMNFLFSISFVLLTPLLLTGARGEVMLVSYVLALGTAGQLLGSIGVTVLKPVRNRLVIIAGGAVLTGLVGPILIGVANGPILCGIALLFVSAISPVVVSYDRTMWQIAVPAAAQGRFFGARRMLSSCAAPAGFALAGPTADVIGRTAGLGVAGGYRAVFLLAGALMVVLGVAAYFSRGIRAIAVDHDRRSRPDLDAALPEGS